MAAQDQSLFTKNYQTKIIKNGADKKCQFYEKFEETVDHLVYGCSMITPNEYLQRYDSLGQYIHWETFYHRSEPGDQKHH